MSGTATRIACAAGLTVVVTLQVAWLLQPVPLVLKILQLGDRDRCGREGSMAAPIFDGGGAGHHFSSR